MAAGRGCGSGARSRHALRLPLSSQVSQSLPALAYAGGDPLVNPNTGTNGPLGLIATILFVFVPTAFLIVVYLKDPGTEKDRFGTR